MALVSEEILKKWKIDGDWDIVQYNCINPTNTDVYFDLFNPSILYNVPNTPYGYVQPSSSTSISPPTPIAPLYPNSFCSGISISPPPTSGAQRAIVYIPSTDRIYINNHGNNILVIDPNTDTLLNEILVPTPIGFNNSYMMIYNPINNRVYMSYDNSNEINIIDCATETLIGTYTAPLGDNCSWIALDTSTNRLYALKNLSSIVHYFDASLLAPLPIGSINLLIPTSSIVYYNNGLGNFIGAVSNALPTISIIDTSTNLFTSYPLAQQADYQMGTAYDSNKKTIYYFDSSSNIREFDTISLNPLATSITFPVSSINLEFLSSFNRLYAVGYGNVVIVDTVTNTISDTIVVAPNPAESRTAYVPTLNKTYIASFVDNKKVPINILCNVSPPLTFYITGSSQYNQDIRDFMLNPAWIRRILFYSHTEENFKQVLKHIYKDANGNECLIPRTPSLAVGVNQLQGWIGELDFKDSIDMILGINQWFKEVLIKANSQVTFILVYKQIELTKLLSNKGVICNDATSCHNSVEKVSEYELAVTDQITNTDFKQNMYLGMKEKAVVPFNFDLISGSTSEDCCID